MASHRALINALLCLLLTVSTVTISAAQHKYTVQDLGTLGGESTYAKGMNSLGEVTGSSSVGNGVSDAFLYHAGKMTDLTPFGGMVSGTALNDVGQIVGIAYPPMGRNHAAIYANGTTVDLGTMGGISSYPNDINNSGDVVICAEAAPEGLGFLYHTVGKYVTSLTPQITATGCPYAINASGQMAGGYRDLTGAHAFFYNGTSMIEIGHLGGNAWGRYSWAFAMNDKGQVVGSYLLIIDANDNRVGRGFLYSNGVSIDVGDLGGALSGANDINNHGEIVGSASTKEQPERSHAFLLIPGRKMIDLNKVVHLGNDWELVDAIAINDNGQIVASGHNSRTNADHAFLLTPRKSARHK